jgi:outer membrane protein assembly complex protein YaeT
MTKRVPWLALALAAACRSAGELPPAPPPAELMLAFEGAQALPEEELRAQVLAELARLETTRPGKAAIDDAAFALELFYRSQGHAFARVDYELEDRPGAPVRALFRIDEGPRVRVGELALEGVTALEPSRARAFLGGAAEGGLYDAERLRAGAAQLAQHYQGLGYLRAVVGEPESVFSDDRSSARVRVAVVEGPLFRVTEVAFAGGAPEFAGHERELAARLAGRPFTRAVELELVSTVEEDYGHRGYPDIRASSEAELDEASGDVRLLTRVEPGPRVVVMGLRVLGNQRAKDELVRERLGVRVGDVYDAEAVRAGFRELYATGLFQSIRIELAGEGSERELLIEVQEARSVEIRVEPGWGSYEGPRVLLGITEKNFRGLGQRVSLEGTASLLAQGLRLGWVDPSFLGLPLTSELAFFAERREEPSFEYSRVGAGFFLRRRWSEEWSSSVGYEYRPTDVTDDDLQAVPTDIADDADVAVIQTSMLWDDRDNRLLPTCGRKASASLEWADDGLGSRVEFLRGQLDYSQLFRLPWETGLAASARTGVIAPAGMTDEIPLPERFFNGGESSVRSFRQDELGPSDVSGDPIGGEAATTLNLELRRAIAGNLAAALFADAGNVTLEVQDYLRFEDFRYGVGLGVRYLLPIGPVRLDLGINPDPRDGEDDYVLHFSVGFPY